VTDTAPASKRTVGSWLLLGAGVLLGLASVALAAVAWLQPMDDLSAAEAREFTIGALEAAGFDDVEVRRPARSGVFPPGDDPDYDVWVTVATVEGEDVVLWIDREGVQAVQIDDNTPDGPLLTEDEFVIVDGYGEHPGVDDRRRRNLIASALAAAGVIVAGVLVWLSGRLRRPVRPVGPVGPVESVGPVGPVEAVEPVDRVES
jgi:hypothetical protein